MVSSMRSATGRYRRPIRAHSAAIWWAQAWSRVDDSVYCRAAPRSRIKLSIDRGSSQLAHALPEGQQRRSEEHTSELQSLMRISYAVFCLKKKKQQKNTN